MALLPLTRGRWPLRGWAVRLCLSWAAEAGRAYALLWAPQCLDPVPEPPERWDWTIPHVWYESSR
ncbi:hypothetical protein DPM19_04150 [Actinomadura craniellae]|uniref:Uncharacterized protein n=1 Tax=Actinomadura craniellae TaxID=2231787 RepID=A0A365HCY0_9ACTN|nr:hypothetical protein [Actinomadura craniellae]RAY16123.1 hypothetical protein DPM19_04150 [Actinomadura craniellae]